MTPGLRNGFSLAVTGDVAPSRRLFPDGDGVAGILRDSDAAIGNFEGTITDARGPPAGFDTGMFLRTPPHILDDLLEFGFDGFAAASNHSADFLWEGMASTMTAFEERNVPYAGLGRRIESARAPAYLDTPAGRLGFVAVTNELKPGIHAGTSVPRGDSRPGVAPLRTSPVYRVTDDQLDQLESISETIGLESIKSGLDIGVGEGRHLLLDLGKGQGVQFVASEGEPGVTWQLSQTDTDALREQVEQASRRSDVAVASLHVHAGANGRINDQSVPEFLEIVAHECVEAGADVVICHGPHVLRGIEIADGSPIFYSLGDFAIQYETIEEFPAEMYAVHQTDPETLPGTFVEMLHDDPTFPATMAPKHRLRSSVLPVCTFDDGMTIELYPLDLGADEPVHRRGRPRLAGADRGAEILDDLERLSAMYGTTIERSDGVGVVRIT